MFINIHSCGGFAEQLPSDLHVRTRKIVPKRQNKATKPLMLSFWRDDLDIPVTAVNSEHNFGNWPPKTNPLRITDILLPVRKENQWYSRSFILQGAYSCHKIDFSLLLPLSIFPSHPLHPPPSIYLSLSYLPIYSAFPQSISLCLFYYHLSLLPFLNLSLALLHIAFSLSIKMPHLDPFSAPTL